MPTLLPVTRKLSIVPLFDLTDPDFTRWYAHGVWWAMHGDFQGLGPYEDTYLIRNVSRSIEAGHYASPTSGHLPSSGFLFGMLHGGYLVQPCASLVILTDIAFSQGYDVAEALPISDAIVMHQLQLFAAQGIRGIDLAYELGCLTKCVSYATTTQGLATAVRN